MPSDKKMRGKRRKKRRFQGNTKKTASDCDNVLSRSNPVENLSDTDSDAGEEETVLKSATPTTTEKKLQNLYPLPESDSSGDSEEENADSENEEEEEEEKYEVLGGEQLHGYRLGDMSILNQVIVNELSCKVCGGNVTLREQKRNGLASEFVLNCTMHGKKCDNKKKKPFYSCPTIPNGNLPPIASVNRRALFAMRCASGGHAELQTFCGLMNLPRPVTKRSNNKIQATVMKGATEVQRNSMVKAAKAEHALAEAIELDPVRNLDVSLDGTYLTRGHTSQIGITTCIGCVTGKVLDADVLSRSCKSCDYWKHQDPQSERYQTWAREHPAKCTRSHQGSAGSMESQIALTIYMRSVAQYQLRYTRFIGDGDVNSFLKVAEAKPYGADVSIEKVECTGHVQKRMGTRLRKLKSSWSGRKLADGKAIGGRGRLTDAEINKIQQYYGNAIRDNTGDLNKMRAAGWAIYYHKRSSDEEPTHNFCGDWCSYQRAKEAGELEHYKHQGHNLPIPIMDLVKPIFKDLCSPELMRRCLDGYTQNSNESINNLIWKYSPKVKCQGPDIVRTALAIAVCVYNDGAGKLKDILEALNLVPGDFTLDFLANKDTTRVICAQRKARFSTKEYRRALRLRRLGREEELAALEGVPYMPGGY